MIKAIRQSVLPVLATILLLLGGWMSLSVKAQGNFSAQIQLAFRNFVAAANTWTGTQTFNTIIVSSCTGCAPAGTVSTSGLTSGQGVYATGATTVGSNNKFLYNPTTGAGTWDSLTTAATDTGPTYQGTPTKLLIHTATDAPYAWAMTNANADPTHYGAATYIDNGGAFWLLAGKDNEGELTFEATADFPDPAVTAAWAFTGDLVDESEAATYSLGRAVNPWAAVYANYAQIGPGATDPDSINPFALITDQTATFTGNYATGLGINVAGIPTVDEDTLTGAYVTAAIKTGGATDLGNVTGLSLSPSVASGYTHDVESMTGVSLSAQNGGSGTVSDITGFYINTGGGHVTRNFGVYVGSQDGETNTAANVAYYAASADGPTNSYYAWFDAAGVFRVRDDKTFNSVSQAIPALYNPQFTKYTPGAANYERIILGQWESNVATITTEKGGTGVLRALNLGDASVQVQINGKAITLSGNLTTTGAFNPTFAIPSSSTWSFPSGGGTLAVRLVGSATIDFASINDGACADSTSLTVTGAVAADKLAPAWPTALASGLTGSMFVSAADTVTVRLCNLSGASVDPASGTFGAAVIR